LTSQGHPHSLFRRALERGNLLMAETAARELGRLTLADALELTALIALKDARRFPRAAARWLRLYLDDAPAATLEDAALAIASLAALAGPSRREALATLRALAARASDDAARAG
jgi:hypothetical protein